MKRNFVKNKPVEKIDSLERLENFRDAKNSLYLEVGNMYDINNMNIKDFNNLFEYISRKDKIKNKQPVPLRESNKRMIQATKDKRKEKNKVD